MTADTKIEMHRALVRKVITKVPLEGGRLMENTGFKEYKIISQRDHWFTSNFNKEEMERALNELALDGWRLITAETVGYGTGGFGGNREELYFFLERDRGTQ